MELAGQIPIMQQRQLLTVNAMHSQWTVALSIKGQCHHVNTRLQYGQDLLIRQRKEKRRAEGFELFDDWLLQQAQALLVCGPFQATLDGPSPLGYKL